MKKIIFVVLVLISFIACSNGTSHNDEPVYTPTPVVSDSSSTQVDDEYYMRYYDYYTCDYWLLVNYNSSNEGTWYHHYVATESNPTNGAIDYDIAYYDRNQNLVQTTPMRSSFNLEEGWFGDNVGVKIHKVGRDWLDDNGNTVLRYLKTQCVDLRDPANPTWKVF